MTTVKINHDQWLAQLKVGDEVAYGTSYYGRPQYRFSKIKSISPKARIITLETGDRFDAYGDERDKATLHPKHLLPPGETRERVAQYQAEVEQKQRKRKLLESARSKIEELSLEQLESLNTFLTDL